ncbi:hypothetical protein ACOME3_002532 [Neoechinorhynchus agilis]
MPKESIDAFLMACRNTPHATTGIAPATMMLGRRLNTIFDNIKPNTESRVEPRLAAARDRKGSEKKMSTFDEDQPIQFKEDKASPWGSGKLVAINGPVSYGVQDDNGRERRCNTDFIREKESSSAEENEKVTHIDLDSNQKSHYQTVQWNTLKMNRSHHVEVHGPGVDLFYHTIRT